MHFSTDVFPAIILSLSQFGEGLPRPMSQVHFLDVCKKCHQRASFNLCATGVTIKAGNPI